MPRRYTCAACLGTFWERDEWTDADANAEAEAAFGVAQASERADMERVCDDCYREVMRWRQWVRRQEA
jgi:hypothetical protein